MGMGQVVQDFLEICSLDLAIQPLEYMEVTTIFLLLFVFRVRIPLKLKKVLAAHETASGREREREKYKSDASWLKTFVIVPVLHYSALLFIDQKNTKRNSVVVDVTSSIPLYM